MTDFHASLAAYTSGVLRARAAYKAEHPTPEDIRAARAESARRRRQERKADRG